MKILLSALFSVALIWVMPSASADHLNNLSTKPAHQPSKPAIAEKAAPIAPSQVPATAPAETEVEQAPVVETPVVPATHEGLMAAAGIQPEDYGAVDYIVSHESSWNPNATEPTTGAHGLPQALPYSKTGCGWTDAICQLQWANSYAQARYGGWWGAYNYWVNHRNW